jgi:hypothetical protein
MRIDGVVFISFRDEGGLMISIRVSMLLAATVMILRCASMPASALPPSACGEHSAILRTDEEFARFAQESNAVTRYGEYYGLEEAARRNLEVRRGPRQPEPGSGRRPSLIPAGSNRWHAGRSPGSA